MKALIAAKGDGPDSTMVEEARLAEFLANRIGYVEGFGPSFFESWAQPQLRDVMAKREDVLEVLIVEDSDRDLGVARAVAQSEDVLRAAALFAAALEEDEEIAGDGSYLRFGASNPSRFIYLPGAANILGKLGRLRDSQKTGATT